MSDTPTPPEASGDAPTSEPAPDPHPGAPEAPRRKRPWTILERLSQAVREQNWFAVVLEVLIVIVGVVIGFQVTGWGQASADAAKERAYLHQLVDDLQETETLFDEIEPLWAQQGASVASLLRPFRSSSMPPGDSVLAWMNTLNVIAVSTVVTGTATALVETGDLNLIRNDSLRTAITSYLGRIDRQTEYNVSNYERIRDHLTALSGRVDMVEAALSTYPPGFSDSLARANPAWPVSAEAPERAFAPLDVEAFYRDREAYTDLVNVMQRMFDVSISAEQVLDATVALREQVEAELDP